MQLALESFAREYVDEDAIVVRLWDQAGFHQTGNMDIPVGIDSFSVAALYAGTTARRTPLAKPS